MSGVTREDRMRNGYTKMYYWCSVDSGQKVNKFTEVFWACDEMRKNKSSKSGYKNEHRRKKRKIKNIWSDKIENYIRTAGL